MISGPASIPIRVLEAAQWPQSREGGRINCPVGLTFANAIDISDAAAKDFFLVSSRWVDKFIRQILGGRIPLPEISRSRNPGPRIRAFSLFYRSRERDRIAIETPTHSLFLLPPSALNGTRFRIFLCPVKWETLSLRRRRRKRKRRRRREGLFLPP